jgi:carbamoyltransferase
VAAIPSVLHADQTCRLQTVSRAEHPHYARVLSEFHAHTGVPMVLNTSFNDQEPIVFSPADAVDTFLRTQIDALYLEGLLVLRNPQERPQG